MERGVDEPDDHGQPRHLLEDSLEVASLDRQQQVELLLTLFGGGRHDHGLHDGQPVLLHEHVLRSAQSDSLRTVLTGLYRVAGIVGVGPHLQAAEAVGPAEDRARGRVLVE